MIARFTTGAAATSANSSFNIHKNALLTFSYFFPFVFSPLNTFANETDSFWRIP